MENKNQLCSITSQQKAEVNLKVSRVNDGLEDKDSKPKITLEVRRGLEKYFKIYPNEMLCLVYAISRRSFDETQKKEFEELLRNNLIFRIFFTVHTPPEGIDLRFRLYRLSPPILDHYRLILLSKKYQNRPFCRDLIKHLAKKYLFILAVDLQKRAGKPGSITHLRETYIKSSTLEDGTLMIEKDAWPWAKIVQLFKKNRAELHCYLLKDQTASEFKNFFDLQEIRWMQCFRDKRLRDIAYEFKKKGLEYHIYCYKKDGTPLEGTPFPFALKEKYKPLISKQARLHPLEKFRERGRVKGERKIKVEDQEAELAFFKSILKYTREKGNPPGYFELAIVHELYEEYQKGQEENQFEHYSIYEERADGISMIENVQSEPQTDFALTDEVMEDLLGRDFFKDKKDIIIARNYGKTDQEIADIIAETLGGTMTKQGVQKRRVSHIEPIKERSLEIKRTRRELEERGGKKSAN